MYGFPTRYPQFDRNNRVTRFAFNEIDPTRISSAQIRFWIDATKDGFVNGSNAHPPDRSGFNVGYSNALSTGPVYTVGALNGKPAYVFGSPTRLVTSSNVPYTTGRFTLFMACRVNHRTATSCIAEYGPDYNGGYTGWACFTYATTPEWQTSIRSSTSSSIEFTQAIADNKPKIFTWRFRGAGTSVEMTDTRIGSAPVSRISVTSTTLTQAAGAQAIYIGARGGSSLHSNLVLGEFMFFDGAVSDTDMFNIETYLRQKWGG